MKYPLEAYLDIETTGLSPVYSEITVAGIHRVDRYNVKFIQLVGEDVTTDSILEALEGVDVIYTYNGSGFDLPFIYARLGIDLAKLFTHHDLMLDCWKKNLYGGFKAVERQLGIARQLKDVNGEEAVRLWWRYVNDYDENALTILLEYNREDVLNLKTLKERLLKPSGKTWQKEVINMRKILIIEDGQATPLNETKFTEEGKLQDYLEEYPALIPLSEIVEGASDLICIGREVGAGMGAIDLLFIDKDGLVTIVETKLRRNREARREVVGQIMEYASYVTQWTVEDILRTSGEYFSRSDKVPSRFKNKSLVQNLQDIYKDDFIEEDFRANIVQNFKDGRIRLIIAVDELIEPLRALVTFLNSHSNFDILLLQVSSFAESPQKRALIPLLFGYTKKTGPTPPKPPKIDEEIFLAKCKESEHEKSAELYLKAKALMQKRSSNGDFMNWGVSGYSYRLPWKDYPLGEPIFLADCNGNLTLWLYIIESGGETGQKYLEKLRSITDFGKKVDDYKKHKEPGFSVDKMTSKDIDRFIALIDELGQALPNAA